MLLRRRLPMHLPEFDKLDLLPLTKRVTDMDDKSYGSTASYSSAPASKRLVSKRTVIFLSVFIVVATVCITMLVYYRQLEIQESESPVDTYIRLPRSIHPVSYELWLQPFINGDFSLHGSVKIVMNVTIPTSNVTLHINDIITKNETVYIYAVDDRTEQIIAIKEQLYDPDKNFYIAKLESELQANRQYVMHMEYEGLLNDQLRGFYRSSYYRENGTLVWLAATQFQPTDARRAFPCFDEPAMKATFQVHLARQTNMTAISNMPKINTTEIEGDWVWDHFDTTLPMSTYLVAMAVSDFISVESNYNDHVTFGVWARQDAINQTWYANKVGPEILTYFEEYFSIPFPLPKQDMIALPDFAEGAMENWGLITYRETTLLLNPSGYSAIDQEIVSNVIAHELAHQWFGDLVTMEWWSDLWLNEGFATFLSYLGTNSCEPDWNFLDNFVITELQIVFGMDCLESSHPVSVNVEYPSDISQLFDDISYKKGASIIRMMYHFLTEGTFRAGLTNYLNNHRYSNADQDDLWTSLTEQGHNDSTLQEDLSIKTIMDTWTLQKGYPIVNVDVSEEGDVILSQKRFLLVNNMDSSDTADYKWWVPISYTTQESPDFTKTIASHWLSDTGESLVIKNISTNGWHFFNIQQTGYYRVNYNTDNWQRLTDQLKQNLSVIDLVSRAQLIDDAMDLARAGELNYSVPLHVNTYLAEETEFVPWSAAMDNLAYLETMFTRTGGYVYLRNYLLSFLIPLFDEVGFEDDPNDSHEVQNLRILAVTGACALEYKYCVSNATALYASWMENPQSTNISENLKPAVYCTAIARGSEHEWTFAWSQYTHSNVASERRILLKSMACSREVWILSRLLDMAFTEGSGVRKQDAGLTFNAIAANDIGRDLAWDFIRKNIERIATYMQSMSEIGKMILCVTSEFNTQQSYKELMNFKEQYEKALGPAPFAVEESLERTSDNIAWMDSNYDKIAQWLHENGYENLP